MSMSNLTPKQLRKAASLKEQISKLQNQLASLLGGAAPAAKAAAPAGRKRRKFSAAGIARIRAAQKARWAKIKAGKKA